MKKYNPSDVDIDKFLNRIKQSIIDDVGSILPIYSSKAVGFFAIPRLLFPEIDGLGAYLTGNSQSTTDNIISYFRLVLSQIDSRYSKYAVFIAFVYRHGLLHQHAPKTFEYKKKDIGWWFSINNPNNPLEIARKSHLEFIDNHLLSIDMNVFYDDILKSIDIIKVMIKNKYRITYIKAVLQQVSPLNKTNLIKRNKSKIKESDFSYFKK